MMMMMVVVVVMMVMMMMMMMMVTNDADSDAENDNANDSNGWSVITGGWLMKILAMIQHFVQGASIFCQSGGCESCMIPKYSNQYPP